MILGLDKPSADDLVDGTALAGTRDLEELINDVFRENKGKTSIGSAHCVMCANPSNQKVEALTA